MENQNHKRSLQFITGQTKEELRREIAASLTPEQRLLKLNSMVRFSKNFSPNYHKALERRINKGNYYILK